LVRDARSLSMLITEASVNHDRPGARAGKVGKLLRSLARDDVGRGIKAVINYAITRSYLKIKTVFLTSMRLDRRLLPPFPRLSLLRPPFAFLSLYFFADFQGSANPSGFVDRAKLMRTLSLSLAPSPSRVIPLLLDLRSASSCRSSLSRPAACRSFCYTRFPRHL